jgi:hypothetical protein
MEWKIILTNHIRLSGPAHTKSHYSSITKRQATQLKIGKSLNRRYRNG